MEHVPLALAVPAPLAVVELSVSGLLLAENAARAPPPRAEHVDNGTHLSRVQEIPIDRRLPVCDRAAVPHQATGIAPRF